MIISRILLLKLGWKIISSQFFAVGGFGEAESRLKSEFLSEPRSGLSKPDMVRTVPIVQENRTEKKHEDGVKEGYPPSSMEEEKRSPDVTGRSSQPCSTSKQETRYRVSHET